MTAQSRAAAMGSRAAIARDRQSIYAISQEAEQSAILESRAAAAARVSATPSQAGATKTAIAQSPESFIATPTPSQRAVMDAHQGTVAPHPHEHGQHHEGGGKPARAQKGKRAAKRPARPRRPRKPRAQRAR